MISIICIIRTIVLIFIVICTTFRSMGPPAFFRYFLSDLETISDLGTFFSNWTLSVVDKAVMLPQESSQVRKEGSWVQDVSRVWEGSHVWQEIPEEGRRAHRPKCCTDNNEDEDNSPNNTNNTNYQASSQKFREIVQITIKMRTIVRIIQMIKPHLKNSEK